MNKGSILVNCFQFFIFLARRRKTEGGKGEEGEKQGEERRERGY